MKIDFQKDNTHTAINYSQREMWNDCRADNLLWNEAWGDLINGIWPSSWGATQNVFNEFSNED